MVRGGSYGQVETDAGSVERRLDESRCGARGVGSVRLRPWEAWCSGTALRAGKGSETILPVSAPSLTMIAEAARYLGWVGDVVGPVSFGGVCFWAVADVSRSGDGEGRPEVRLSGCLLTGHAGPALLRKASLLAAYTPRAVLVGAGHDLTGVLVDAAILDQGVVVAGAGGVQLLATAGPRVAFGPITPREQELLRRVYAAWCEVGNVSVPKIKSTVVTRPTVPSW
jgi:hypothetical protein